MLEINRGLYDFNYYYLYLLQYLRSNKYEVDNDHPRYKQTQSRHWMPSRKHAGTVQQSLWLRKKR